MSRAILWFRHDQRLADNEALDAARSMHDEMLPVFIIDPKQHGPSPFGFDRSGPFRRKFIAEGLNDLDARLKDKGSALQVHVGDPAEVLRRLGETWNATTVHAQRLYSWEEHEHERSVAEHVDLRLHEPDTLLHPDDLPFAVEQLPHVFTAFRTKVEKQWAVREPRPEAATIRSPKEWNSLALVKDALHYSPFSSELRAVMDFHGGRTSAVRRLSYYCGSPERIGRYKETRNGLLGADFSGKFSPWLASGAMGAREVYREVKAFEAEQGANESTYWMIFELLWRDFFHFIAAKHGRDLFLRPGIAHKPEKGNRDERRFAAWCEGRTGQAFIDANMRELAASGWMSNRGRQNVASYLVHDLGLDWRMGAYWFERMLIDYDPCSNWGNWQYVAGVGKDPREGRRFDPVRQAGMYDPDEKFVRHWLS